MGSSIAIDEYLFFDRDFFFFSREKRIRSNTYTHICILENKVSYKNVERLKVAKRNPYVQFNDLLANVQQTNEK